MKTKIVASVLLAAVMVVVSLAVARNAAAAPNVTFNVLTPLPANMVAGQTYDFVVEVTSNTEFISVMAQPSQFYPGRYLTAQGVSRDGAGTSTLIIVTYTAKSSTADLPGGVAPVSVTVGVRFQGGAVIVQRYDYNVSVP